MKKQKFQQGGFVDETDLFDDAEGAPEGGNTGGSDQTVASEYVDSDDGPPDTGDDAGDGAGHVNDGLTGIDLFLADYGVRGGLIKFDDDTQIRFDELPAERQKEVLSSLVEGSTKTVEDRFDLDDSEVMFLNAFRDSGAETIEDFVNGVVDHRVDSVINEHTAMTMDFDAIGDDDIYLLHLKDNDEDMTEDDLVSELEKAKNLSSYERIVDGIRDNYIIKQNALLAEIENGRGAAYREELEGQRHEIVDIVANMEDVAGSPLTDAVKEALLHDMMELNEHNDPILMEKIFGDPETMFKANWFLTYGEDYIRNLNEYWKREVSKAAKNAYEKSINGMPANPTIIGADRTGYKTNTTQPSGEGINFGKEVSEEELFDS